MDIGSILICVPDVALEKIFSFLTYDEIAKNRAVCKKFNDVGGRMLSRGFIQLERYHGTIYKRIKAVLPRRESERRVHPLARHCDILQAVETRMSMLSMTYMKYIEKGLVCFIPGKVLDEISAVLKYIGSDHIPHTPKLLQEMRDLSSMAMEHFDEQILPKLKEQKDRQEEKLALPSYSEAPPPVYKPPKAVLVQQSADFEKIKKQMKVYKSCIGYLNQKARKLLLKVRKQNRQLESQAVQIRDQDRKIQEQTNKIEEQSATIAEVKKNMEEWDQKYKGLTTELIRARDYLVVKPSGTIAIPKKPKARPRVSRSLLSNYSFCPEFDRKRKSSLLPDIPVKINRVVDKDDGNKKNEDKTGLNNFIEELLTSPFSALKSRKRKITEELE